MGTSSSPSSGFGVGGNIGLGGVSSVWNKAVASKGGTEVGGGIEKREEVS